MELVWPDKEELTEPAGFRERGLNVRYAMEKMWRGEEVQYDTMQVCDSLEKDEALTEDTPWREIGLAPKSETNG